MNQLPVGVPLSTETIPQGTGLVQSIECKGIKTGKKEEGYRYESLLETPVVAQITTFANGTRRICCLLAYHGKDGEVTCNGVIRPNCIYAWKNPSDSK